MESLTESYGITFNIFQEMILQTNSLVAGSTALMMYLKQEGIEPGYEANDMDIFTHGLDNLEVITTYLVHLGYTANDKFDTLPANTYKNIDGIFAVQSFMNENGKEIQVIVINGLYSVYEFVTNDFDLSCCMSWWNATTNKFRTKFPDFTLKREMFCMMYSMDTDYRENRLNDVNTKRITKYLDRGFNMIYLPHFPITIYDTDIREDIYTDCPTTLNNKTAFDVWAYEDVDCCEFIAQSPWHMLLRVGEQYHAFHRENLHLHMKDHTARVPHLGVVYKTPFNQSVIDEAYYMMLHADYTIFELIHEYSTSSSGWQPTEVSMFTVKCYTIAQWTSGLPGMVISPSQKPAIPENILVPLEPLEDILEAEHLLPLAELVLQRQAAQEGPPPAGLLPSLANLMLDDPFSYGYSGYSYEDYDDNDAYELQLQREEENRLNFEDERGNYADE